MVPHWGETDGGGEGDTWKLMMPSRQKRGRLNDSVKKKVCKNIAAAAAELSFITRRSCTRSAGFFFFPFFFFLPTPSGNQEGGKTAGAKLLQAAS